MSLLIQSSAQILALQAFLNSATPQNQTLNLYVNNITPAETDTAATYTAATGGGYASIALTGSSWTYTSGTPSYGSYAQQTWTFTGALTTNPTIYGYYVTQTTSGAIMWAERFGTSFTPANNGDQLLLTPIIQCGNGTPT